MVKCLCNKNAALKYNRVSKDPFIACANHFSFTKTKCKLTLDLKRETLLENLNQAKGIKLAIKLTLFSSRC